MVDEFYYDFEEHVGKIYVNDFQNGIEGSFGVEHGDCEPSHPPQYHWIICDLSGGRDTETEKSIDQSVKDDIERIIEERFAG